MIPAGGENIQTRGGLFPWTNGSLPLSTPTVPARAYGFDITSPGLSLNHSLNFSVNDDTLAGFTSGVMDDFTSFMDSVPIPTHPFSPIYEPVPFFVQDSGLPSPISFDRSESRNIARTGESTRPSVQMAVATNFSKSADSSLSQFGSRLPSLQPEDKAPPSALYRRDVTSKNFHPLVSAEHRQRVLTELTSFPGCIEEGFVLPSRHALSRYFGGYFHSFHGHFPFLHTGTLRTGSMNVELFLAIASLGARYRRELDISIRLFHVAKAVVLERFHRYHPTKRLSSGSGPRRQPVHNRVSEWDDDKQRTVEMVQTLILIIAITTWCGPESAFDALSIRSVLDSLIRGDETLHVRERPPDNWESWIRYENLKRMLFVAFCFLNIHTIVFDIPPMMLAGEMRLDLPCSEREWRADNEKEWREARDTTGQPCQDFQEAFRGLFANINEQSELFKMNSMGFSSLGGCALIHAVIQQIWLVRNSRLPAKQPSRGDLLIDEMNTFERALKRWAIHWERNQESSMDPLSPHGPVAFTSTALLRLAYIRVNLDLGPIRCLSSWDPYLIAKSLYESPPAQRCEKLTRAALHCAHALSIPVKLGLDYVAQTQVMYWSNQHALCSLECALLLSKWLESVTVPDPVPPLTAMEERLLNFVVELVVETDWKVSCEDILQTKALLHAMIVRLWARLYQSGSVWEMVNLIGKSLNAYADLLERQPLNM